MIQTPQELADELIGTCNSAVPCELLGDSLEAESEFDSLAFLCEGCGWWCSTDELHNTTSRNLCEDCSEDDDED